MFHFSIILFSIFIGSTSFAQEVGTSEATTKSLTDYVNIALFSNFHGPEVTDIGSANVPGSKGLVDQKRPTRMNFDSNITALYRIDDNYQAGAYIPFYAYPVMGEGFVLGDVGVQFGDRNVYRTKDLRVAANVTVQAPTLETTKLTGMDAGVKFSPNVRYNVPNSRFTLGAWTEAKAYLGVNEKQKSFKLWAQPYVSYQVAPKFLLNLGYEMEGKHVRGTDTLEFVTVQNDLLPGFIYFITSKIMINPYVQIFTTEKIAMDRTAVGAIISASL